MTMKSGDDIGKKTYLGAPSAIIHVPSERGEFHDEDHLGTCDFHGLITEIEERPNDMAVQIIVR